MAGQVFMNGVQNPMITDPALLFHQGLTHFANRQWGDAALCLRQVLAQCPDHTAAHHALGLVLWQAGQNNAARASWETALTLDPCNHDIRQALVTVLSGMRHWADMLEQMALLPASADTWADRALALNHLGQHTQAEQAARNAVALDAGHVNGWNNLGVALMEQERWDEAAASLAHCPPDCLPARNNLAHLLTKTGQLDRAITLYSQILEQQPSPETRFNRAHAHLLAGNLPQGFADYEARLDYDHPGFPRRFFDQPSWQGGPWQGTLLIHAEQGFGDSIQFARFLPSLAQQGKVVVEAPAALCRLLSTLPCDLTIIAKGQPLPAFDCHCPLISLGLALGITLDDLDGQPYLHADPVLRQHWRHQLEPLPGRKVGIVWQGNPTHANDRRRSIPFEALTPLWSIPGIHWVNLQPDATDAVPGLNPGAELTDFAATAALMAELDFVVSIDSAPAHLAGALGLPCALLLPCAPDWRWLLGRCDSPWYASLRLFRQNNPGDWGAVLGAVMKEWLW